MTRIETPSDLRKEDAIPQPPAQKHQIDNAVLADILKTLEQELQSRGLLPTPDLDSFHPLWFLAETERNIFLWRNGFSLIQQDEFEFWVDLEALIQKRLAQLTQPDTANPFINPLWELSSSDADLIEREKEYLAHFIDALRKITAHAEALSKVASLIKEQVEPRGRRKVILPNKA